MFMSTEHRECSRSPVNARIEVRLSNGVVLEGEAVDVSLRGLMFLTERRLPVGKSVLVVLLLDGGLDQQRIEVGGHVARLDDDGVAVEFTQIDADSVQHLRRLVLYNAPDVEQAQYEIANHIGIERKN